MSFLKGVLKRSELSAPSRNSHSFVSHLLGNSELGLVSLLVPLLAFAFDLPVLSHCPQLKVVTAAQDDSPDWGIE